MFPFVVGRPNKWNCGDSKAGGALVQSLESLEPEFSRSCVYLFRGTPQRWVKPDANFGHAKAEAALLRCRPWLTAGALRGLQRSLQAGAVARARAGADIFGSLWIQRIVRFLRYLGFIGGRVGVPIHFCFSSFCSLQK